MAIRFQNQRPMDWYNRGVTSGPVGAHNDVTACWGTYKCKDGNYVYLMFLGAGVMKKGLKLFGYEFGVDPFPPHRILPRSVPKEATSLSKRSRNSAITIQLKR